MKLVQISLFAVTTIALGLAVVRSRAFFEHFERVNAQQEAIRRSIEQQLSARLVSGDSSEKVEYVLKDLNLKWSYNPAYDGVHCIYGARRNLNPPVFVGIEIFVALEEGVWRFSNFEVKLHHPFI